MKKKKKNENNILKESLYYLSKLSEEDFKIFNIIKNNYLKELNELEKV